MNLSKAVDALGYSCYRNARKTSPHTPVSEWLSIFHNGVAYESRLQREVDCAQCGRYLDPEDRETVGCRCEKYGYGGHEDSYWCSVSCMEDSHPDPPDVDPEDEHEE